MYKLTYLNADGEVVKTKRLQTYDAALIESLGIFPRGAATGEITYKGTVLHDFDVPLIKGKKGRKSATDI